MSTASACCFTLVVVCLNCRALPLLVKGLHLVDKSTHCTYSSSLRDHKGVSVCISTVRIAFYCCGSSCVFPTEYQALKNCIYCVFSAELTKMLSLQSCIAQPFFSLFFHSSYLTLTHSNGVTVFLRVGTTAPLVSVCLSPNRSSRQLLRL